MDAAWRKIMTMTGLNIRDAPATKPGLYPEEPGMARLQNAIERVEARDKHGWSTIIIPIAIVVALVVVFIWAASHGWLSMVAG